MTEMIETPPRPRPRPRSVLAVRTRPRRSHTVSVSESAITRLRQMAAAGHTSVMKLVDQLVSGEQVQAAPTQVVTTGHNHDDCAMACLKSLPPEKFDLAKEICYDQLGITPYQLVAGHLRKLADQGTLQAPLLDSGWTRVAQASQIEETRCEWAECRAVFLPARVGQRFCSPRCGGAAARADRPAPRVRDSGTAGLATGVIE